MASISSYYDYDTSLTPYYASLIALDLHLANTFFGGDLSRVITASNDYALRKRSDQNKEDSNLNFPFMNYKRTEWDFDDGIGKWSNPAFAKGVYLGEIGKKVRILPSVVSFESTLWFATEKDAAKAYHNLRFDSDGLTELTYDLVIDGTAYPMWVWFTYNDASYSPDYNENDWLEQNKIKTISLNFTAHFFDIEAGDSNFSITEKVIHEFQVQNQLGDVTYEEFYEYLQNRYD